ncbi:MAG TPA: BON domain-containing protein [Thermodesulfobacteriota bacterium]
MTGWIETRQTLAFAGAALLALAGPAAAQDVQQGAREAGRDVSQGARETGQAAQEGARDAQQGGEAVERQTGSGQPLSDAWITAKAKLALYADEAVSGTDINVDTSGAVVTLTGEVESQDQKARAVQIARGIEGVQQVQDQLTVRPSQSGQAGGTTAQDTTTSAPGASGVARRDDEQIASEVRQQIQKRWTSGQLQADGNTLKGPQGTAIEVSVDDGVVTLDGTVGNVRDILTATEAARAVDGVRAVKTNIESGQTS